MTDEVSAAAVLWLGGFVLLAMSELDGEIEPAVETSERQAWCRACGCCPGRMVGGWCGCGICRRRRPVTLL